MPTARLFLLKIFLIIQVVVLSGCTQIAETLVYEKPLREPVASRETDTTEAGQQGKQAAEKKIFYETPKLPSFSDKATTSARPLDEPTLSGAPVNINIQNLPLPAFINEVYGNLLGLSFEIENSLKGTQDLVTLRITEPQPLIDLFRTARTVLASYGVSIQKQGDLYRFVRQRAGEAAQTPLLISGRNLPNVPISHRPIFLFVPLHVVTNSEVSGWLRTAYKSQQLQIAEDPKQNAVILQGPPEVVQEALEGIKLLDRPSMRGRNSIRIEPSFVSPKTLVANLLKVLRGEGYAASDNTDRGSVSLIPLDDVNAIIVFASDDDTLKHVQQWVVELDKPTKNTDSGGIFYYAVQNTSAEELAAVLGTIIDGTVQPQATPPSTGRVNVPPTLNPNTAAQAPQPARAPQQPATVNAVSRSIVVDNLRNAILFKGKVEDWANILPVIRELDKAPKQVLIEVTIAEVSLSENESFGIEFIANGLKLGDLNGTLSTSGLGASGNGGLNFILDSAGATRATLNALANDNRTNIISSPRVMVKSGLTATIDVGDEVPIITTQSTAADLVQNGNSSFLQTVQYRRTGTLLNVTPTVHAGRRVDIEIAQEVSESNPVDPASRVPTPTISTRNIVTSLSLSDGGSILLGGLVRRSETETVVKVPLLGDVPLLGNLFKRRGTTGDRRELIILVTPYIVESHEEAQSITETFRNRVGQSPLTIKKNVPPGPAEN